MGSEFKKPEIKFTKLFINGDFVDAVSGNEAGNTATCSPYILQIWSYSSLHMQVFEMESEIVSGFREDV